jgi:hypothetical protein
MGNATLAIRVSLVLILWLGATSCVFFDKHPTSDSWLLGNNQKVCVAVIVRECVPIGGALAFLGGESNVWPWFDVRGDVQGLDFQCNLGVPGKALPTHWVAKFAQRVGGFWCTITLRQTGEVWFDGVLLDIREQEKSILSKR